MNGYINPWKLFVGCFVPNWLLEREEVSLGAKLTYARLSQFAGRKGVAVVHRNVLALKLATSERSVTNYVGELEEYELVEAKRRGAGGPTEYHFKFHPWMGLDSEASAQDVRAIPRKIRSASAQDVRATPISKENQKREERLSAITAVYTAWKDGTGRNGTTKLTSERRTKINARLDDGYTVQELVTVVTRGWRADPWAGRVDQNDLVVLLRDGSQVEKFLDLAGKARRTPQQSERDRALAATAAKLDRAEAERRALSGART